MKFKKSIYLGFALIISLFVVVGNAQAADFRVGVKNNGNVNVNQNEKVKSLYSAGNIISINADIEKSVHTAGNVTTINGSVGNSVYSVGGTLIIKGDVGGSVHGAGGNIVIDSDIEDDLILGGGNISVSSQASVGGDLVIGGGTVDVQGPVLGNVYIGGGVITINSEINGNVKIDQADEIKLGSNAKINGNLDYNSKKEIEIEEGAIVLGETTIKIKKDIEQVDKSFVAGMLFTIISIGLLIKIIGLVLAGMAFLYFFKKFTETIVEEGLSNFWRNLGIGFAVMILTPIAAIILIGTIIGAWIGVVLLMTFILFMFISCILSSLTFGSWIHKIITKEKKYIVDYKALIIGVVSLTILSLIPVIGWLLVMVFILVNLGMFYQIILKIK